MYFLRAQEKFSLLVKLVVQCLYDVIPFTIFLISWVTFFGMVYRILGMDIEPDDYDLLPSYFIYFIQTFRNSVGDIGAPSYSYWSSAISQYPLTAGGFIFSIWMAWLLNQFLVLIILLNFLIAIISQSYEEVMSRSMQFQYTYKCILNREIFLLIENPPYPMRVLQSDISKESTSEWTGFVSEIKKTLKGETSAIKRKIDQVQTQVTSIAQRQQHQSSELQQIKAMLQKLK